MKKHLLKIIIVIFMVVELILIIFNFINKYKISKKLKIDNMNDFSIQELKESLGYGSSRPIFIKFKISFDKYKKYNLQYQDVTSDDCIYEGEITNKKQKMSDNYYICYYETVIYGNKEKQEFRVMKNNRFFLKVNSTVLIFLLFIYVVRKIINLTNQKVNYAKERSY